MKRLQVYPAPGITVTFDPNVCVHSAVCVRTLPKVFDVRRAQWIHADAAAADEVANAIDRCPSGALQYYRNVESDSEAKYRLTKAVLVNRVSLVADGDESRHERAHKMAAAIRDARGYDWVGFYDVDDDEIAALAWTGDAAPAHRRFPRTQGLNGAAVSQRAAVVVNDVGTDSRYLQTHGTTRAEMVAPVLDAARSVVLGTIDVASDRADAFTRQDVELLEACAAAASPLWESA